MNPKAITFRTPNDYLKKILHPYSSTKIYFVHNKSKDHLSLYKIIANIRAVISSPYPNNWQQQKKQLNSNSVIVVAWLLVTLRLLCTNIFRVWYLTIHQEKDRERDARELLRCIGFLLAVSVRNRNRFVDLNEIAWLLLLLENGAKHQNDQKMGSICRPK